MSDEAKPKNIIESAISGIKGRDIYKQVDRYTEEVTTVLEGMNADLHSLYDKQEYNSAEITIITERLQEYGKRLNSIEQDIKRLQDSIAKEQKRKKGVLQGSLKQITWIALIISGAWVITALLRTFGG
ncbi:MAG: hypothetical protein ACOX54_08500 [Christensenellales bacterium]|jgi:chromosome segregation ATPase